MKTEVNSDGNMVNHPLCMLPTSGQMELRIVRFVKQFYITLILPVLATKQQMKNKYKYLFKCILLSVTSNPPPKNDYCYLVIYL